MVFKKGQIPWNKGVPRTPEVKQKVSIARKGQHNYPKTEFKRGMIPWNRRLKGYNNGPKNPFYGKRHSEESRKKMSETRKNLYKNGWISPMLGKRHKEETRQKISLTKEGKPNPKCSETKKRLCKEGKIVPWNKGKPHLQKEVHPMWGKRHTPEALAKMVVASRQWHATHKMVPPNLGKSHTLKTRRKISEASKRLWTNPDYRSRVIQSSLKGLLKRPTSLERKVSELISKYRFPLKYCGNGTFLIGYKNPDFCSTDNKKICVEVANRIHHKGDWAERRKEHFDKYGWKCEIIWWEEVFLDKYGNKNTPNWEKNVSEKLRRFISS